MKAYVKAVLVVVGAHLVRCVSEHYYYVNCSGVLNSVFSWGSPTCRGLRWASDTSSFRIIGTIQTLANYYIQ